MAKPRTKRKKGRRRWPFVLLGLVAAVALVVWLSWAVFTTVIQPGKPKGRADPASQQLPERILPEEKKELEEILRKRK